MSEGKRKYEDGLWKSKKPYLSAAAATGFASLEVAWHLDSTGLAVLFITFMAQPGPRSSGLFNCNETTIMMLPMKKKKQMW